MTRNIVVLVLDTVRKDTFDRRATEIRERSSISFKWAYAPSSWTVPSHASMFTGDLPYEHGIHAHNIDYSGLSQNDTFLGDIDHRTVAASANSFLSQRYGFDRLFDEFIHLHGNEELIPGGIDTAEFLEEADEEGGLAQYFRYLRVAADKGALVPSLLNAAYMKANNALLNLPLPRLGDYGARMTLRAGRRRAVREEPFFLFVNVVDAHAPHEVLRGYDTDVPMSWTSREHGVWEVNNGGLENFSTHLKRYDELYGCAVEYLDRRVASFADAIRSETAGETTIIVTADHGEELGRADERTLGHKIPSAAVTHVPLEIINPPDEWESETVSELVGVQDLGDIVLAIDRRDDWLPPLAREAVPTERLGDTHPPSECTEFWDRAIRTVYSSNVSYEWDTEGARNRYRLSKSAEHDVETGIELPDEARGLYGKSIEEAKVTAAKSGHDLDTDVDSRTRERLEDLGYM